MAHCNGIVKWFDNDKGYGFLLTDEGQEIFMHHSQLKEKKYNNNLHEGQLVLFDLHQDTEGFAAMNIIKF